MISKEELRTRVEAELLCGKTPRELSEGAYYDKYTTPYVTILNWKKKLDSAKPSEDISKLTNETKATLEVIREVAKDKAPIVSGKIDKLIDGIEGLKELDREFQETMLKAVTKAKDFLNDDELTIKEWQMVTTTLATAYSAMFNKAGTTVNVSNNNVNIDKENLGFFKSNQRAI